MPYAQVAGWGMYVPSRIVTNEQLVQAGLDTSDEWITTRTGIRERRVAAPNEATSDLAAKAAQRAMEVANVRPRDIDLIIVATCTPDHLTPATAALVQDRLGAINAGALDLNAACSGFMYALSAAAAQIEAGRAKEVLIIGADVLTRYVDWKDRSTCVLFGDGAGALLLQASGEPGVLSVTLGSDGAGANLLIIPGGGSRMPANGHTVQDGEHYLKMSGRQVFREATQAMEKAARKAIRDSGLTLDQIDLFIPHQANTRIIESTARRLGLDWERVFVNLDRYGNTTAASIPIALCEAIRAGKIQPGQHIMLASFGAGLSWAAAVIRWGVPLPVEQPALTRRLRQIRRRLGLLKYSLRKRQRQARGLWDRFLGRGEG